MCADACVCCSCTGCVSLCHLLIGSHRLIYNIYNLNSYDQILTFSICKYLLWFRYHLIPRANEHLFWMNIYFDHLYCHRRCINNCTNQSESLLLFLHLQEIKLIIPNSQRINRGNYETTQLMEACRANDVTDVIIVHEHRGVPGEFPQFIRFWQTCVKHYDQHNEFNSC